MYIHPLVEKYCTPILPLVYDDSLSYMEVLCKVQTKLNEIIKQVNNNTEILDNINEYVESITKEIVNEKLTEWEKDGTLESMINAILFKEYAYFNMKDITPSPTSDLSTYTMYHNLINDYSNHEYFNYSKIGDSVNGVPIYDFCIGKVSAEYNVLAFGGHHAREYQSTYVLYNDIRYIMENIDNSHTVHGYTLNEIFDHVRLHIVLSANPDMYNIIVDNSQFNKLSTEHQTNLKNWLTTYIRSGKLNVGTDVTQSEYNEILNSCNNDISTYNFRLKDIKIWKSNLHGVDLHYNCYNENNEGVLKSWATSQGWSTSPSPMGYIGETGFSEPENKALLNVISSYAIRDIIDLHQRGPTLFWAFKYGGRQYERNKGIAEEIGAVTQTPVSISNNGRIGFGGWFYANYEGFCGLKEIGWSYSEHYPNGSYNENSTLLVNPLPTNTLTALYENEKHLLPFYCEKYGRKMDVNKTYQSLNRVDVAGHNSILNADNGFYLISLDYLLQNYRRTLDTAKDDVTLLTLGKTNAVGTRHVMYLSADGYPNIERPSDTPTQAGMLIRESAGTMFSYWFMPIGFNQLYWCCGYSNNLGQWKRIDTQS